jgi:hypothetical protein
MLWLSMSWESLGTRSETQRILDKVVYSKACENDCLVVKRKGRGY